MPFCGLLCNGMARAISSLPVPFSPIISTGISLGRHLPRRGSQNLLHGRCCCRPFPFKTVLFGQFVAENRDFAVAGRPFPPPGSPCPQIFQIQRLGDKPVPLSFIACTAIGISPRAETRITCGGERADFASFRRTSSPVPDFHPSPGPSPHVITFLFSAWPPLPRPGLYVTSHSMPLPAPAPRTSPGRDPAHHRQQEPSLWGFQST